MKKATRVLVELSMGDQRFEWNVTHFTPETHHGIRAVITRFPYLGRDAEGRQEVFVPINEFSGPTELQNLRQRVEHLESRVLELEATLVARSGKQRPAA